MNMSKFFDSHDFITTYDIEYRNLIISQISKSHVGDIYMIANQHLHELNYLK